MIQQFFSTLGRIYRFLVSLVVALVLGAGAWACWGLYQEARIQQFFDAEGKLVSCRVVQADHEQRSWRDILSPVAYLTLSYRGKDYTTRYVMDSAYVGAGDRVSLVYHAGYDALRQERDVVRFDKSIRESRLIHWSTVQGLSNQNQLLGLCILLAVASFFLISGLIQSIIPIRGLAGLARLVFVLVLLVAAVFFTYDGWMYARYYQHLKTTGEPVRVQVLDTDRIAHSRHSRTHSRGFRTPWYDYQATIRYQQQERIIPISVRDFETLKPPTTLMAYYDWSVNDFMSVDYGPAYSTALAGLLFWLLAFLFIRPLFVRKGNPDAGTSLNDLPTR